MTVEEMQAGYYEAIKGGGRVTGFRISGELIYTSFKFLEQTENRDAVDPRFPWRGIRGVLDESLPRGTVRWEVSSP